MNEHESQPNDGTSTRRRLLGRAMAWAAALLAAKALPSAHAKVLQPDRDVHSSKASESKLTDGELTVCYSYRSANLPTSHTYDRGTVTTTVFDADGRVIEQIYHG